MRGNERRGVSRWRFDRLPGTQSRVLPCSGHLPERSWPYDWRKIRRMTGQLGFALLLPRVRAVVFRHICPHRPHLSWRHRQRSTSSQLASTRAVSEVSSVPSHPPPRARMRTSVRVCMKNAHSSSAERQEEVINRGVNVTRRRGRPRFEATNAVPDGSCPLRWCRSCG